MENIFLAIGSNLGDRGANLQKALLDLEKWDVRVLNASSIYETAPLLLDATKPDQPDFYNMIVRVKTEKSPQDLLTVLLAIERSAGRIRKQKWEARVLDLDIIFYGDLIMRDVDDPDGAELIIPHQHAHERKFVLQPLAEIAPEFIHPVLQKNVALLLKECRDEGRVTLLSS